MKDIPPSAIAPAPKPAAAPKPRRRRRRLRPSQPPATTRTTSTRCWRASTRRRPRPTSGRRSPSPKPTCSNSPTRWHCRIRRPRAASSFNKIEPQDDIEFTESAAARRAPASRPMSRRRSRAPPPAQQILSRSTVSAVEFRLQFAGQYRAQQQRADAGRSGQGNAAADAEILARRQSAGIGGADRQGRNRAGFARRALAARAAQAATYGPDSAIPNRRDRGSPLPRIDLSG